MKENFCLLTDSYKFTHFEQIPPKTTNAFSHFLSRGVSPTGPFRNLPHAVMMFGLQYPLQQYFEGPVITMDHIAQAESIATMHYGRPGMFNRPGFERIVNKHGGHLPLRIRAVPEGTIVHGRNVLVTVDSTDEEVPSLTNVVETLAVQTWYPTTVATLSWRIKQLILKHLEKSGDPSTIDFKLHDFGFRGVSSVESAGIGGLAHLVNFKGTDTPMALVIGRRHYDSGCAGFTIPAMEHFTVTVWGRHGEASAYRNMIQKYPDCPVAIVSDSYDIYNACQNIFGEILREEILARKHPVIVRLDSGDPHVVAPKVLEILGAKFGYTVNAKGYKVLHPNIRTLQGDGVYYDSIDSIYDCIEDHGWSADNLGYGMGGGLLQKLNRDDLMFAFKCSSAVVDGEEIDVRKSPVTDVVKRSMAGRLALVKHDDGSYETVHERDTDLNELCEVFKNGEVTRRYSLEEVRRRAAAQQPVLAVA